MFSIKENCLNQPENIYEPVEKNIYYYKGLNKLNNFDDSLKIIDRINNYYVCSYRINNEHLYPFLEFLLHKDLNTNMLSFPALNLDGITILSKIQNLSKIQYLIETIFSSIDLNEKYDYNGYYYSKNNMYLFFDFTNCKSEINTIYKNSQIWPVLVDEIINTKHVCNIEIKPQISDFFNKNMEFTILTDNHDKIYDIPCVTYTGKKISKLNFTYVFGMTKPDNDLLFGSYYYFTNFKNSIKKFIEENKGIKGGVVRFALFLGSSKVILNNISDSFDESNIKRELINCQNNLYENLTLRITDYDGKWSEKYDSVYVGDIELDNGEKLRNTPIYAVKNYEQQIPLSYHFIDINKECQIL